jgi:hypothetical protein
MSLMSSSIDNGAVFMYSLFSCFVHNPDTAEAVEQILFVVLNLETMFGITKFSHQHKATQRMVLVTMN